MSHFKHQFQSTDSKNLQYLQDELTKLPVPKLSQHMKQCLESPITDAEIKNVVFMLGAQKAPGPDGIHAFFYQKFWRIVKQDIFIVVKAFFHSGFLLKSLNHSFITLIPKINSLEEVSHFRPISLCNVNYKIIFKLLVNRLKPFMDSLITFSKCIHSR